MQQDTIFALSTPPGKSGVAVIRLSGSGCEAAYRRLTGRHQLPPTRLAALSSLYGANDEIIDKALILYFKAPHSFSGEDMLELHTHGGMAIIQSVLAALTELPGVRPAEPGEFMRRAFFNEKLDLLEVEAVADMIDAETSMQLRQAIQQMQGQHSQFFKQLRSSMVEILALLEAYIDFPEEDIPEKVLAEVTTKLGSLQITIRSTLEDNRIGERIRSGFRLSIVGAPNVGKSTLLNQMVGRQAAIVSSYAGTTRDIIEVAMDLEGFPLILCDTAGLRHSTDEVEKLGMALSEQSLVNSDIILAMVDGNRLDETLPAVTEILVKTRLESQPPLVILLMNKVDAMLTSDIQPALNRLAEQFPALPIVPASADSRGGIENLLSALSRELIKMRPIENPLITRERHRKHLVRAYTHLQASQPRMPLELLCEEVRLAAQAIGKITGEIKVDELLGVIFSRFCIGK